jgi:hypothetical protein
VTNGQREKSWGGRWEEGVSDRSRDSAATECLRPRVPGRCHADCHSAVAAARPRWWRRCRQSGSCPWPQGRWASSGRGRSDARRASAARNRPRTPRHLQNTWTVSLPTDGPANAVHSTSPAPPLMTSALMADLPLLLSKGRGPDKSRRPRTFDPAARLWPRHFKGRAFADSNKAN